MSASVKIMLSYNYCHFEISKSIKSILRVFYSLFDILFTFVILFDIVIFVSCYYFCSLIVKLFYIRLLIDCFI